VCDAMWHAEGSGVWKYYTTENEKYSMTEPCLWEMCQEPYLALMMRYDGLESGNGGVRLKDGVMVYMDKDEKRVMRQYGTLQTGQFARRTVALHLQEGFTDVFATDGSKSKTRAAYGVWEGPAHPRRPPSLTVGTRRSIARDRPCPHPSLLCPPCVRRLSLLRGDSHYGEESGASPRPFVVSVVHTMNTMGGAMQFSRGHRSNLRAHCPTHAC
jgi:hypothetical protein